MRKKLNLNRESVRVLDRVEGVKAGAPTFILSSPCLPLSSDCPVEVTD